MRILMLNNEFPPLGGGTGVANYHHLQEYALIPELSIDLITSSRTKNEYEIEQFSERIIIHKVPVDNKNIHHSRGRELMRYVVKGMNYARELLINHKYDLSVAYSGIPAGFISYKLKQSHSLPYVILLRGSDIPYWDKRYIFVYPFLTPLIRKIWKQAVFVSAVSRKQRFLAQRFCNDIEIPIITNGVDVNIFKPSDRPEERNVINVLCVGRLVRHKGQENLIKAFTKLVSDQSNCLLHLTLVGTGDNEENLRKLVRQFGIETKVTFAGCVPHENMPFYYQMADLFVLVSKNEGMSNALLEAIASGLPVVVSNTGGSEEIVEQHQNGYVLHCNDVESLYQSIKLLILDKTLRINFGKKSRNIACSFNWNKECKKYYELFNQISNSNLCHRR